MRKIGFLILLLIVNIEQAYSSTVHPEAQSNEGYQKILPLQGQDDGPKNTPAHQIDISKDIRQVKNMEIVSISKGKNDIPLHS